MMSREKIQFPPAEAYLQGVALLGDAVPVCQFNEKRPVISEGAIPTRLQLGIRELGAIGSVDCRPDADLGQFESRKLSQCRRGPQGRAEVGTDCQEIAAVYGSRPAETPGTGFCNYNLLGSLKIKQSLMTRRAWLI